MRCYICEAKEGVIRLAGPYFSQRFNICKKCLKRAKVLKAGEILEWIEGQKNMTKQQAIEYFFERIRGQILTALAYRRMCEDLHLMGKLVLFEKDRGEAIEAGHCHCAYYFSLH